MIKLTTVLDFIQTDQITGNKQLKALIEPLARPFTALCLRPIDIEASTQALFTAISNIATSPHAFAFFGRYFLSGCVRDDFDFGPVLIFKTSALKHYAKALPNCKYAAFYSLILGIMLHDNEICVIEPDGENKIVEDIVSKYLNASHFDYVDPRNRDVQIEMERAFTAYLKAKGTLLEGIPEPTIFNDESFPVEASVIIPVKNRTRTITDALNSALSQQTELPYNVIVVDNHSNDGTTEKIQEIAQQDSRLIHIIPTADNLGIGGCWNLAAQDPRCGKFCIQLDSDDIYSSPNTVQTILNTFYAEECGMVVGSYTLTDFDMNIIPPGLIDHREWTDTNGRNNLLRVNGIGAPRAFYTPLLRKHPAPNVSYGEDYALALVFSRLYRIGRVYESLYFCRRWEDNTDANPDPELKIKQNRFKDQLRTIEIQERKREKEKRS